MKVMNATNQQTVISTMTEIREQLQIYPNFGYMTIANLIELGSFCGVLPPICYTFKQLPKTLSSGSNRLVTSKLNLENSKWKEKQEQFQIAVTTIQNCSSKRIFETDIENGMCELSREERNCRKKECIFWDKSMKKIQCFFRIHKTNISKNNAVTKFQIQVLNKKNGYQ